MMLMEVSARLAIDPLIVQAYPTARQLSAFFLGQPISKGHRQPNDATLLYGFEQNDRHFRLHLIDEGQQWQPEGPPAKHHRVENWKRLSQHAIDSIGGTPINEMVDCTVLQSFVKKWRSQSENGTYCVVWNPLSGNHTIPRRDACRDHPFHTPSELIRGTKGRWSRRLKECVDGAVTILECHSVHPTTKELCLIFASCHGGVVMCLDAASGQLYWEAHLDSLGLSLILSEHLLQVEPSLESWYQGNWKSWLLDLIHWCMFWM